MSIVFSSLEPSRLVRLNASTYFHDEHGRVPRLRFSLSFDLILNQYSLIELMGKAIIAAQDLMPLMRDTCIW